MTRRPPLRNCDECRFADIGEKEMRCAHGHKPAFLIPNDWTEVMDGTWGWMLRCRDFALSEVPAETRSASERANLTEQMKWRMKAP